VKADTVVLFDTYGSTDSRLHSVFLYHLEVSASHPRSLTNTNSYQHNLKSKGFGLPYEFRSVPTNFMTTAWLILLCSALESILLSVLSALEAEMVFIRNLVGGLLAELEDNIDRDRFKRLLHYSRRLASFQNRAKLVSDIWKSPRFYHAYVLFRSSKHWKKCLNKV
jgi:magnesium transporter